jgi:hypothetical protein
MVLVLKAVPMCGPREPMSIHPRCPSPIVHLTRRVRYRPLPHAIHATVTRPSLKHPAGDTLFDPSLTLIPRYAKAAFQVLGTCGAVVVYTTVDVLYHFATLIGYLVLRQPAWAWPPLSDCPWTSTSIILEFPLAPVLPTHVRHI